MSREGWPHEGHGEEEAYEPGAQVSLPVISRRRFMGYLGGLISAVIAAVLGIPLLRFYIGNAFQPRPARWLPLGPAAGLSINEPRLFTVSYVDQDGWQETSARQEVYAVTQDGRDFTVFSNICTHLGCPVHWDDTRRAFVCPCHGGVFAIDGRVLRGPPPRPLVRIAHKIEGETIYVKVGQT